MTTLARAMAGALAGGLVGLVAALMADTDRAALVALYVTATGVTAGAATGAILGGLIALRRRSAPADPERTPWRRVWWSAGVVLYVAALPRLTTLFTLRFRNRILSAIGVAGGAPLLALFVLFVAGAIAGALELGVARLPPDRRSTVARALGWLMPLGAALEIALVLVHRRHTFSPDTWVGIVLACGWVAVVVFIGAWLEDRLRREPLPQPARIVLVLIAVGCLGATLQLASGHAPDAVRAGRSRVPLLRVLL